jgi:hypothetical protein
MARVTASGSPSLTSAAAFQTQLRSELTWGESLISGTTAHTCQSFGTLRRELDRRIKENQLTVVVCADLEGLVSAHDQAGLAVLAVLEQADVAGAALLPLADLLDIPEKLGAHLEELPLRFLVGFDLDLLGQADDRPEMDILRLRRLVVLCSWRKQSQYGERRYISNEEPSQQKR